MLCWTKECYASSHEENMKLSWPSVQKHVPSQQNFVQTGCPGVVPMPFKDIGITLCQFLWK